MSHPLQPSLLLPIHKGPQGRRITRDQDPALWSEQSPWSVCGVCKEHQGRYVCPTCDTPYCSVACYRDHNADDSSCTEQFYQKRVSQVMELDVKDKTSDTLQMLNRVHQEQLHESTPVLPEDELYNLLQVIENEDEQELSRILTSPHIRAAIDHAVATGDLEEWLVETWHPWWRPELGSGAVSDKDESSADDEFCVETLDERLLKIPSFRSLRPGSDELPELQYNTVDLLYSTAWALRLYHGASNATDVPIPAANTLVQASSVLHADARFTSLPEVLDSRAAASTRAYKNGTECNTPWHVLAQDVSYLCRNRRHIGRALLEASGIVKAAVQAAKGAEDRQGASELRRMRKKLEFYLSWSRESTVNLSDLSTEIDGWIVDWNPNENADVFETAMT